MCDVSALGAGAEGPENPFIDDSGWVYETTVWINAMVLVCKAVNLVSTHTLQRNLLKAISIIGIQ